MSRVTASHDAPASPLQHEPEGMAARTFRGRSIDELLTRIREELGEDAIVLRRREGLTGGIAGFFQHPFVEIDAVCGAPRLDVYDEPSGVSTAIPASVPPPSPRVQPPPRMSFYEREPPGTRRRESSPYVSQQLAALARAAPPAAPPAPAPASTRSSSFAEMLVQAAGPEQPRARIDKIGPPAGAVAAATRVHDSGPVRARSHGAARVSIGRRLGSVGIGEEFIEELIDGAAAHVLPLAPGAGLAQAVRAALVHRMPVAPPLPTRGAAIAIVGPGGAGKTSCCAALLAAYRRSGSLPASCASLTRGQRRGELDLLLSPHVRTPLPAESPRVASALRDTRGAGLLAIDTPPLSLGDRSGIRALARLLGALEPERVVVALPATLGAVAAAQLLQALRPLGANSLALTHADETDQIGTAIEAACRFELAPEYTLKRARPGGWRMARLDPTELAERLLG